VSENGQAIVDEASVGKMASGGDKKKWEDKQFPLHAKLAQIKQADQIDPNQYAAIFFASVTGGQHAGRQRDRSSSQQKQQQQQQRLLSLHLWLTPSGSLSLFAFGFVFQRRSRHLHRLPDGRQLEAHRRVDL